jgi:hypothetical protein
VAGLRQNTSWIEPFIASVGSGWNFVDSQVQLLLSANITPIIEIGEGTLWCLPSYTPSASDPKPNQPRNANEHTASNTDGSNDFDARLQRALELLIASSSMRLPASHPSHHRQASAASSSTPFDPNIVGEQTYLAYIYRYARAAVHRYKAMVNIWQIENELNEAYLTAVIGMQVYQQVCKY